MTQFARVNCNGLLRLANILQKESTFKLIFPSKHNLDLMVLLNALDFMLHKLRTFMKTDPAIKTDNCLT